MEKPIIKYIGGKTWLSEKLNSLVKKALLEKEINSYHEPFAGGLGSFLSVSDTLLENNITNVFLNDINKNLIDMYGVISLSPDILIDKYSLLENEFNNIVYSETIKTTETDKTILKPLELFFKQKRDEFNKLKSKNISSPELFLFLQKHSFNGIYRENSKGGYNTPFNWSAKSNLDMTISRIKNLNKYFQNFNITFSTVSCFELEVKLNSLVYLDPPYVSLYTTENKYSKGGFSMEDQINLIKKYSKTNLMYSNYSNSTIEEKLKNENIYVEYITRKNIISSDVNSRNEEKIEILCNNF